MHNEENKMSLARLVIDGATHAAHLLPLAFALHAAPAAAQLPRPPAVAAIFPAAPAADHLPAPLALTANHLDLRIASDGAELRTRLTYRNTGTAAIEAPFALPPDARVLPPGLADDEDAIGACSDDAEGHAQYLEAGEMPIVILKVAPGEDVTIETRRPAVMTERNGTYRLVLPLPHDADAPFAPRFSAQVEVTAPHAVRRLHSATHGGTPFGLGATTATLTIPEGRVYGGRYFAVEFDVDRAAPPRAQALPAAWGGEVRGEARGAH
jgi:hypothetical protein